MDGLEGDAATKRRLRGILSTLCGEQSVDDACRMLGIRPSYFGELRTRALAGALVALQPQSPGRPRRAVPRTEDDVDELQREVVALRREVQILRAQLDVTTARAKTTPSAQEVAVPRSKSAGEPRRPSRRRAT